MKHLTKLSTFILCAVGVVGHAQMADPCQKIGFADVQLIAQQLPETRQMEAELASLGGQLQNQLNAKYTLYNEKVREFERGGGIVDEASNEKRRTELMRLEQEIRKFASDAELTYQKKQQELMQPILSRIGRSIDAVASENHDSIIVNTELPVGQKLILFGIREFDISDLVLTKMGVSINQNRR